MVTKGSKVLLKNVIRHTDTHNRMWEEESMWQHKDLVTKTRSKVDEWKYKRHAHMDSDDDTMKRSYDGREEEAPRSTYWMRQLQEAEEKDPNRWGHGGFKELYPEDFDAKRDAKDPSKNKKKKKKKEKKKEKKSKKIKRSKSPTESDSDIETYDYKRQKKAKRHRRRHRSRDETASSKRRTSPLRGQSPEDAERLSSPELGNVVEVSIDSEEVLASVGTPQRRSPSRSLSVERKRKKKKKHKH